MVEPIAKNTSIEETVFITLMKRYGEMIKMPIFQVFTGLHLR